MYVDYLLSALSWNNTEFCKSLFLQNGNHCPNILKLKNEGIIQVKNCLKLSIKLSSKNRQTTNAVFP